MQRKIIAAAVASTAAAIKLQSPTTILAQAKPLDPAAGIDTDCHGTYAYQCMEKKVNDALGFLANDVDDRRNLSLLEARNAKDDMVKGIEDLRYELENTLAANRKEGQQAAYQQMRDGMDRIDARLSGLVESLRQQVLSDSPRALRRKDYESQIKNIYYSDEQQLKLAGREPKKAAIKALLEAYVAEDIVEFGEPELLELQALVAAEVEAMCNVVDSAMAFFNSAAADAIQQMADAIQANSESMDTLNAKLIAAMDDRIAMLSEEFLKVFWETVEDIYRSVKYEERQGLVWKALYQKDAFIAKITAIRDEMVQQLADNKTNLVNKMNQERDDLVAFIGGNRAAMDAKLAEMKASLKESADQAIDDLEDEIKRLAPQSPSKAQEDANLKDFIYDLTVIRFNPNDSGNGHANGVQPYGEWVARRISNNTEEAFHDTLATFYASGRTAVEQAETASLDQQVALQANNIKRQNLLSSQTANFIAELQSSRQALELNLFQDFSRITSTAEAEREADQIAMTTTKNEIWKALSWIVRETLANSQHNHGYRAGPVFGLRSALAQVNDDRSPNPFTLLEKPPLQGWGAEGPEDGYDPYGYGDQGFGFGPAQAQYKEVQEQLALMESTWSTTEASHAARMARSRAEMEAELAQAWSDMTEKMDQKWEQMNLEVTDIYECWAQTVVYRTNAVEMAISQARAAIAAAYEVKQAALDAEEKEIRWAITSIWNYDRQNALNEALSAARAAADATCQEYRETFEAALQKTLDDWNTFVGVMQEDLDVKTAENIALLEDSKAENTRLLNEYKEFVEEAYAEWEEKENNEFAAFMAASREAFEWIKVSYCLKHGQDGDVTNIGYGCSWGTGAGAGNAGYKKGVSIENHMESLTYGQDPLDIKHIQDEAWLIDGAREWTMEGVPEEYARQLEIFDSKQDDIQATIDALRNAIQARLTQHEADANARMDALADAQAEFLLSRENRVIAAVNTDRLALEAEVDAFRVEVQWGIKELVWQLGYTQGYKFGGHDGEDANIMAQITDLKDQYEALIQKQTDIMTKRVSDEKDAAELAYQAAQKVVDDLQAFEGQLLDEAISTAISEFEASIAQGDSDCQTAANSARAGLHQFVYLRLAAWQELYDQEAINAKWQEDSYYRLSLLRLLGEKQAAIDKAVDETFADFDEDLSARKMEEAQFNETQRIAFYDFLANLRQKFQSDVQANDDKIADIIKNRRDSLNSLLDQQMAQFIEAMNDDRAEMKRLLKEVYNYNTHDLDATASATGDAAPWSIEQHNGFMAKLHHWSKSQLNGKDAMLANMRDEYAATQANMMDMVGAERLQSDRRVEDLIDASEKSLKRQAEDAVISYKSLTEVLLQALQDDRAALEALTQSKYEAVRKNVIYSMHVLRYGGGYDVEQTGFGKGASSFHSVGNYLTSHAELDDFRLPNPHGYAQVSDKINTNDDHHDKLETMLRDAVAEFDTIIQEAKAEFQQRVSDDVEYAETFANQLREIFSENFTTMIEDFGNRVESELKAMALNNILRLQRMQALVTSRVTECTAINDANIGKVNEWINDRLAWADKMMESYQKKHLIKELSATQERLISELEARTAQAKADGEAAIASLFEALKDELVNQTEAYQVEASSFLQSGINFFQVKTIINATEFAKFRSAAEAEAEGFDAAMDQLQKNGAYWLKYMYGFQGYEQSIYQDFDPNQDYTDIMSYPSGDGAYPALGTQGPDLGNSGEANLPAGGYGVGGRGGADYLYSGDHAALAYGKFIGPDPRYFDGSILDPSPIMDLYHQMTQSLGFDHNQYNLHVQKFEFIERIF